MLIFHYFFFYYESESDIETDDNAPADPGAGVWQAIVGEDPGPNPVDFIGVPGPKHSLPADSSPTQYNKLFISDALVDILVRETNTYANHWIIGHQQYLDEKPNSRVHLGIKDGKTTKKEIYAFLSIIMNNDLIKKKHS